MKFPPFKRPPKGAFIGCCPLDGMSFVEFFCLWLLECFRQLLGQNAFRLIADFLDIDFGND